MRKKDSELVWEKFNEERKIFSPELLESLADKQKDELQEFCFDTFNETEAALAIWQATITKAHRSPADFAEVASGGQWRRAEHLNILNDVFVDCSFNRRFVIVSVSVRHGKSELISKWAPAWYLSKFPDRDILQISSTKRIVQSFSRQVRDILEETSEDFFGLKLASGSKAADQFGFEGHKGQAFATGIGGGTIGMGGHLIIVDDAYKDIHDAFSPTVNNKLRSWWSGNLRHRLNKGGSIIVVLARWSEKDLAGYLIEQSKILDESEDWFEIKMPMIWESEEEDRLMNRKKGDLLWPGQFTKVEALQAKASVGPLTWAAQFQQDPMSSQNSMFPISNWTRMDGPDLPKMVHTVRYWDLSAGGKDSDFCVGVLMGVDEHGRYFVLDVAREKFEGNDADIAVQDFVRETSNKDFAKDRNVKFFFEQVGGAGAAVAKNYERIAFAGLPVEPHIKRGDKVSNAFGFGSQQQGHNVYIPMYNAYSPDSDTTEPALPEWATPFMDELYVFPSPGVNDDQVDAASGAYQKLEELFFEHKDSSPASFISVHKSKPIPPSNFKDQLLAPEEDQEQRAEAIKKRNQRQVKRARIYGPRNQLERNTRNDNKYSKRIIGSGHQEQ